MEIRGKKCSILIRVLRFQSSKWIVIGYWLLCYYLDHVDQHQGLIRIACAFTLKKSKPVSIDRINWLCVHDNFHRAYSQWRIQKILVGGDLKHKTSKIRMSSPKLRVIFRPKSEIQTFFSPKFRWSPKKKKKKVFTKIESDFSAEIGNSNVFFVHIQVVSKQKKKVFTKIETDFSPD